MNLKKLVPGWLGKSSTVIPVVKLSGVIAAGGKTSIGRSLSLASTSGMLEKAFAIKKAPAVAIAINSPGGSPVQSRLIFSYIRNLASEYEKQVLVFVEDVAASGGYMLALAGDEIFVDETSIIGSIGVISSGFGFNKAIEKLGIDRRIYAAGKNKVSLDPFQPEKKADIAHLKALQLEVHQIFIDMVKERRGSKLVDNPDLFTGTFWTGLRAYELGLIDSFGHMNTVLKKRYGEKTKLRLISPKRSLFGWGGANVEASLFSNAADALVDTTIMAADEKTMRARFGL